MYIRVGDNGWTPDIFRSISTFSDQNMSVQTLCPAKTGTCCIHGGSDFQHEDRTASKMELVTFPCAKIEFSISYALKETATCIGGE